MRTIDADTLITQIVTTTEEAFMNASWKQGMTYALGLVETQPTIQPEPHWIPVTENCDCDLMDNEEVLVFQKDGTINGQIRHAMFYDFNGKKKFVTWEEGITIYNVVAYMPLPEPYKGVTE